ncbi:hypothetical protein A0H81_01465 [Grifola frondosa]|uniref:Uncharacterized protein n=1 Tax=Grifola frondosa TaxID=5627 RepID=A0A1C7MNU7_GRIFR|nr:hypothetical protein A0H81_01465 [Grifola frondosa]
MDREALLMMDQQEHSRMRKEEDVPELEAPVGLLNEIARRPLPTRRVTSYRAQVARAPWARRSPPSSAR